jgi:tripartite-type tricarboxylate transporter receptor subunit TctC
MRRLLTCALALAAFSTVSAAQSYPTKPIRIIVMYGAGSTIDIMARLIAPKMSEALGQPVIVENRPGAGGAIGMDMAAKAAPDGHTLTIGATGPSVTNPLLFPKTPFDPLRDFACISLLATTGSKRITTIPELPTIAEAGYPAAAMGIWYGLVAPAATPKDVQARLRKEITRIQSLPDIRERFTQLGTEATTSTPEQFTALVRDEPAKWGKVIKAANIQAESNCTSRFTQK